MTRILLIGMGAGAAGALLFASVTSGLALSVILFYLTPLPIMIVALGWSHWAGLIAAVTAAAMLAAVLGGALGIFFFATFLTSIGAPAWWLGYLALLGRPAANIGPAQMEWYPPGRLVLWAAFLGAAVTAGALAAFGGDEATIRQGLRGALEQILRLEQFPHPQAGAPADAMQATPGAPTPAPQIPAPQIPGMQVGGAEDTDRAIDML